MRNILFRAKRTDNGEWVEGSLIDSGNHEQVMIYPHCDGASTMGVRQLVYYSLVPVDHDTVCEWTGLYDKNGVKIFEGDMMKCEFEQGPKYAVMWENAFTSFCLWRKDTFYILPSDDTIEVIGNIYDNPDLIER